MELDKIKRIPLASFCMQRLNYTPNKGHDSRLWRSLKSPEGDTIITKSLPNQNGHYLFKCHERDVSGSIIDLLQNVHGMTFNRILQLFDNTTPYPLSTSITPLQKSDTDNTCVVDEYLIRYSENDRNNYLTKRGIANDTIRYFGLTAQEKTFAMPLWRLLKGKWVKQTSIVYTILHGHRMRFFQKGLQKKGSFTIFTTKNWEAKRTVFFFESPIDAISFYQMYKEEGIYISTCGTLTHAFLKDIPHVLSFLKIKNVVIAFDNDVAGNHMSQALAQKLTDYSVCIKNPLKKDWNEELTNL